MKVLRYHRYFINMVLLFASLFSFGCVKKIAAVIDRKTFSVCLPGGWTEDTKDSRYNRDSFVFFENQESCHFGVFIDSKAAGASVDSLLMSHKDIMQNRFTDIKSTDLTKWAHYEGKGFEIEGKDMEIPYRCRIFAFEGTVYREKVCVIIEIASLEGFKKYASDFKVIRQTFNLKEGGVVVPRGRQQ